VKGGTVKSESSVVGDIVANAARCAADVGGVASQHRMARLIFHGKVAGQVNSGSAAGIVVGKPLYHMQAR